MNIIFCVCLLSVYVDLFIVEQVVNKMTLVRRRNYLDILCFIFFIKLWPVFKLFLLVIFRKCVYLISFKVNLNRFKLIISKKILHRIREK
jgi:hypothetical protein